MKRITSVFITSVLIVITLGLNGCVQQPLPSTAGEASLKSSTLNDNEVTVFALKFNSLINFGDTTTITNGDGQMKITKD